MKKVLMAFLLELLVAAVFLFVGIGMLAGIGFAEGPERMLAGFGLTGTQPAWVMLAAGAATAVYALWRMFPLLRQMWLQRTLADTGVRVRGVITDVRRARAIRVNQTTSVRLTIRCTTPSGQELELRSPTLWAPGVKIGEGIDVLFDPENEDRYCTCLPERKTVRDSLGDRPHRL